MKLKIVFCDDDEEFLKYFTDKTTEIFQQMNVNVTTEAFSSGEVMLDRIMNDTADVVFLDIDMPDMSGFETALKLENLPGNPKVIFVTGMDHLVYDSFSYHPFWFLRKTDLNRLSEVVKKLIHHFETEKHLFYFETGGQKIHIPIDKIVYFESRNHDVVVNTESSVWKYREKIGNIEKNLEGYQFIRCHHGFLVNCRHVALISRGLLHLQNSRIIPISRSRQKETEKKYMEYMRSVRL